MSIETGEAKLRRNGVTLTAEQEKKIDQLYKVKHKADSIKMNAGAAVVITFPLTMLAACMGITSDAAAKRDRAIAEKITDKEVKITYEESAKANENLAKKFDIISISLPFLNGIAYYGSAFVEHCCENKISHIKATNQLQVDEVETTN